jgi:N-acetylmuramic acid 6-phosphate etherase
MHKITEQESLHTSLERLSTDDLLMRINSEDQKVADAIKNAIPQISALVKNILPRMQSGGRLFYIGAGTSGRLGIVDASECPPTFGVEEGLVVGIIAGGDTAIRKAVEFAEDDSEQGFKDLEKFHITHNDSVIGIAASGSTPYVVGAIKAAKIKGILTGCITNNPGSLLAQSAEFPIEVVVGPEFITGSTRMKSGTSQKLVLNMISTSLMIQLGRVKGNKMVDMQLSNSKLVERGAFMVQQELQIDFENAKRLLLQHGSVRKAINNYEKGPK